MLLITATLFWIGLTDTETEDVFKWIDNDEVATFTDFYPGEPGRGTIENCAVMFSGFDYKWGDYGCSRESTPICEKR